MDDHEIWSDRAAGLTIRLGKEPSAEVVACLSQVIWGSKQLRYRLPDIGERLRRLRDPFIFVLRRNGALAAICILDRCWKNVGGRPYDTFHFMLVATIDEHRAQGLGGLLMAEARRFSERTLGHPGLGFGYVESTTVFSLRITDRIGHAISAEMPLVLFSRLRPTDDVRVGLARADERDEILARLGALYADHELDDFAASLDTDRFLVLRDGDKIRAGAQIEQLQWSVVSLPGAMGALLLKVLPYVPILNRRLNPSQLRLLRFGNLLVEPGHEAELVTLLEAALVRHGVAMGLMMLDRRSPVLGRILAHGHLGLLRRAVSGSVFLRLDFVGVTDKEITEVANRPLLASPADVF